jgi:lipopolysaccharide export system protein LptA
VLLPALLGVSIAFFFDGLKSSFAQDTGFEIGDTATAEKTNLDIQADFSDYDQNLGIARATGDVIVKYGDVTIEADQVEFHQSTGKIFARDNVRVFRGGEIIDAEEIIYNIKTGEMTTSQFKSALEPILVMSDNITKPEEGTDGPITLLDATFTTHDSANPDHRVFVKKLEVYPDDKIVMHGAKIYMGDRQVFWFPYYVQPMDEELGYYFVPGWNSAWGAFLLNQYGFMINDDILAKAHFDFRSERGLAGGFEFEADEFRDNKQIGRLNLYYAEDSNPQIRFNGRDRKGDVTSSRYRVNFQHRIYFPGSEDETFFVDFDINKLSDEFIYEDFFPSEFRIDPRPDNLININKLFPQGEISLTGRFQVNDFHQTDTRSPELAIDVIRTPIGDTGFYYQGLTTYGILDEEYDADRILAGAIEPSGFNRFQTYHEVLFPTKVGGVLNVVPRAGTGYANYNNFEMPGLNTFESTTTHAGVDLSFKMSKRSPHVTNRALGLNGLLHVVRPYVNYSYLNTNEISGRFTPIDRFTPTTRLRAIDLPLFTSMDEMRDWSVFRTGVSQRFITKRNGHSYEWLALNNYIDIYDRDPEFNRNTSNFFTEIDWRPLPWLSASTTAQLPLFDDTLDFTEVNSLVQFMPTDWFHFGIGHYFLNDHPFFRDSDLYSLHTYTRLGDEWGFSTSHRFERDDNTLEYQQYSIHKDFASWTASLGGIIRDNRQGENEYGVLFSLTLKAFPKVALPVDFQPGSLGAEE